MEKITKETEQILLGTIYPSIGMDKPSNHDNIVAFIVEDIKSAADVENFHSGDVAIGFRRFIENNNLTGNKTPEIIETKIYEIPISWESYKRVSVEASSLQEAVIKALKQFLSEPDDLYLEDTFQVDDIILDEYPSEDYSLIEVLKNL